MAASATSLRLAPAWRPTVTMSASGTRPNAYRRCRPIGPVSAAPVGETTAWASTPRPRTVSRARETAACGAPSTTEARRTYSTGLVTSATTASVSNRVVDGAAAGFHVSVGNSRSASGDSSHSTW